MGGLIMKQNEKEKELGKPEVCDSCCEFIYEEEDKHRTDSGVYCEDCNTEQEKFNNSEGKGI